MSAVREFRGWSNGASVIPAKVEGRVVVPAFEGTTDRPLN
jgi:hypothetical protein